MSVMSMVGVHIANPLNTTGEFVNTECAHTQQNTVRSQICHTIGYDDNFLEKNLMLGVS